ncbi:MAG: type II secretion system protein GspL [Myxococcales bacterium]|nr:type II secretion system protein GspL [Myxococcales bacterium]
MALILGLDIADDALRGVLLRTQLRRVDKLGYLEASLPPPLPDGSLDRGALRAALHQILDACPRPPDHLVAELDGREASVRSVQIPAGAAKRIAEVLPFELETMLPFDVEDAIVDYQPIGEREGQLHVLAAAAPKARVRERLEQLSEAGCQPKELAVGAAALDGLIPLLPELQASGTHLLVDIGAATTDLCVITDGRCELARTLSGGMQEVRAGRRVALERDLDRTLAAHRARGGKSPTGAFVSGQAASLPGGVEWIGGLLGVPAAPLPLPELPGATGEARWLFARAAALAGRATRKGKRLDLRRGEFAPPATMGALRQHIKLLGVCAAAVLLSFAFSVVVRYRALAEQREGLRAELSAVTEELFDVETSSPTRARELLEGGRSSADPLPRFDAFATLDAISAAIPTDMEHRTRRLDIEIDDEAHEGRFELQGTVDSIAERDRIAQAFEEHECFTEIKRGPTSPGPSNQGLNYRLEVDLRCPGAPTPTKNMSRRGRGSR